MKIAEIREKLAQPQYKHTTVKDELVKWLTTNETMQLDFGLTLMPKKVPYKTRTLNNMKQVDVQRHLSKVEIVKAAYTFVDILNKVLLKNAYKRLGKKLTVVMTIEGEKACKDLHVHIAFNKPTTYTHKEVVKAVGLALQLSNDFMIENTSYNANVDSLDKKYRYKLDIIDSGWLGYITKELSKHTIDNFYLP